jgi:hypothetical protein
MEDTALVFGFLSLFIGAILVVLSLGGLDTCGSDNPVGGICESARELSSAGSACIFIGIVLLILAVCFYMLSKVKEQSDQILCPACRLPMTPQDSPMNCFHCGYRVDLDSSFDGEW